MIEREFEDYLALLRGLLRLRKTQCDAIADELRDHMDARLEDLLAEGVPKEKAVQIALQEFGDAAGVGQAFLEVNRNNQRRWNMKVTAASLLTCTALGLAAMAFWPDSARHVSNPVMAQAGGGLGGPPGIPGGGAPTNERSKDENNALTAQKLAQVQKSFDIDGLPIAEVGKLVHDMCQINVIVDDKAMQESGANIDAPVSCNLKDVRLDTALELILKREGAGYYIHDGIVIITSHEALAAVTEVRVYNVADLVYLDTAWPLDPAHGRGMGAPSGMGPGGTGMPGGGNPYGGGAGMTPPGVGGYGGGRPGGMRGSPPGGIGGPPGGIGGGPPGSLGGPGGGDAGAPGSIPGGPPRGGIPGGSKGGPGVGGRGGAGGSGFGSEGGPGGPGIGAPGAGGGSPGGSDEGSDAGASGVGAPRASLNPQDVTNPILAQMGGAGGMGPGGTAGGGGGMMAGGSGGMGGGSAGSEFFSKEPSAYSPEERRAVDLIHAVTSAVETSSWSANGGEGEIRPFEGLLIIRNTPKAHQGIDILLQQIRAARHLPHGMMGGGIGGMGMGGGGTFGGGGGFGGGSYKP